MLITYREALRQGLFAQGTLGTGSRQVMAVPVSALRVDKAQPYVQTVSDGRVLHQSVTPGERGVVAGEIVVCRELPADTSQLYSGSREAWLKDYAERTQNAGTLPPPDVAGPGIAVDHQAVAAVGRQDITQGGDDRGIGHAFLGKTAGVQA